MDLLGGYGSDADASSSDEGQQLQQQSVSAVPRTPAPGVELPPDFFNSAPQIADEPAGTTLSSVPPPGVPADFFASAPPPAALKRLQASPPASKPAGVTSALSKLPAPKISGKGTVKFRVPIDLKALDSDEEEQPKKRVKAAPAGTKLTDLLPKPQNTSYLGGEMTGNGRRIASLDADQAGPAAAPTAARGVAYTNEAFATPAAHPSDMYAVPSDAYAVPAEADMYGPARPPSGNGQAAGGGYGYSASYGQAAGGGGPYYAEHSYQYQQAGVSAAGQAPPAVAANAADALEAALAAERDKDRRRGRGNGVPSGITFKEVRQQELTYMHPAQRAEMAGSATAMGPGYEAQLRQQAGPAPDKTAKRKHQISTLYHQAKLKELELLDKKGQSVKSKAETQAKYGW